MALGFFRRRQKMVMIIMVVLMVSFLIGFQGFQSVLHRSPERLALGETSYGTIRVGDVRQAESDLRILTTLPLMNERAPTSLEYRYLVSLPDRDRPLAYALLVQEAQHYKARVGQADVDEFLASVDMGEDRYESYIRWLQDQWQVSERGLHSALKRWLSIHRTFSAGFVFSPPSEQELRVLARDLYEKIDLRILRFTADQFLDRVNESVDPNRVAEQFARYRGALPGMFDPNENPYGFGYYQPERVELLVAYVARDVVQRAMRPTRDETDRYYLRHRAEFFRTTLPASTPSTASAPAPEARPVRVAMTPSEAMPEVYRRLTQEKAAAKVEDLSKKFLAALAEGIGSGLAGDAYQTARSKMVLRREAAVALDTEVDVSRIPGLRLDEAMSQLAREANLVAIAFPWGQHGQKNLSEEVAVSLDANAGRMPLREALRQIAASVHWPPIDEWSMCEGLGRVVFPLSGEGAVDFFPVVVRRMGPLDLAEFRKDELLGAAIAPSLRVGAAELAFTAEPFGRRAPGELKPMKEGQDGPTMQVMTGRGGLLHWRLLKAVPGQPPPELTDAIRPQVEKDVRLLQAMDLAYQAAERIRSVEQFAAADANGEANAVRTGLFSRQSASVPAMVPPDLEELVKRASEDSNFRSDFLKRRSLAAASIGMMLTPETADGLDRAPEAQLEGILVQYVLGLPPNPDVRKAFLDAAFSLAPSPRGEAPLIGLLRMPARKEVLVLRRVGFQPLTLEDYRDLHHYELLRGLQNREGTESARYWFSLQALQGRVGWVPEARGRSGEEPAPEE